MSTLQISLPDELQNWIEREARRRGYANAGEFVGVLLHEEKTKREVQGVQLTDEEMLGGRTEAEVAALLNEGLASEAEVADAQWWDNLRDELAAKLKKQEVNA